MGRTRSFFILVFFLRLPVCEAAFWDAISMILCWLPLINVLFPFCEENASSSSPSPVASATPTNVSSSSPSPVASATPTNSSSSTPSPVPSATPTSASSSTPSPVPSATPTLEPCSQGFHREAISLLSVDIDECDELLPCDEGDHCENTPGSYICLPQETIMVHSTILEESIGNLSTNFLYDLYGDGAPESETPFPVYSFQEKFDGIVPFVFEASYSPDFEPFAVNFTKLVAESQENGSTSYVVDLEVSLEDEQLYTSAIVFNSSFIIVAGLGDEEGAGEMLADLISWPYDVENEERRLGSLFLGHSAGLIDRILDRIHPCPEIVQNKQGFFNVDACYVAGRKPKPRRPCLLEADQRLDEFLRDSKAAFYDAVKSAGIIYDEHTDKVKNAYLGRLLICLHLEHESCLKEASSKYSAGLALARAIFDVLIQDAVDALEDAELQACPTFQREADACMECEEPTPLVLDLRGMICGSDEEDCSMCVAGVVSQEGQISLVNEDERYTFQRIRNFDLGGPHIQGVALLRKFGGKRRMVLTENKSGRHLSYLDPRRWFDSDRGFKGLQLAFSDSDEWKFRNRKEFRIRNKEDFGDYSHPGGCQAHGDLVAIAMEKNQRHGAVLFLQITGKSMVKKDLLILDGKQGEPGQRSKSKAATVGFVKVEDGRFLVAVSGKKHGLQGIFFYIGNFEEGWRYVSFFDGVPAGETAPCGAEDFDCVKEESKKEDFFERNIYFGAGGGLNLVTDCSGTIYMITMSGACGFRCTGHWYQLFQLSLSNDGQEILPKLIAIQLAALGSRYSQSISFRYSGGVGVEDHALMLMNTERTFRTRNPIHIDGNLYVGTRIHEPTISGLYTSSDFFIDGVTYRELTLTITNAAMIPPEIFAWTSRFGSCNNIASPSRTWISIYDSDSSELLIEYCRFHPEGTVPTSLSVNVSEPHHPGRRFHIEFHDRELDYRYTSNDLEIVIPS